MRLFDTDNRACSPLFTVPRYDHPNRAPTLAAAATFPTNSSQPVTAHAIGGDAKGRRFLSIPRRLLEHFTTVIAHQPIDQPAFDHFALTHSELLKAVWPPLFHAIAADQLATVKESSRIGGAIKPTTLGASPETKQR